MSGSRADPTWVVGYGYRPWRALGWVAVLLLAGFLVFGELHHRHEITAMTGGLTFNPFLYALDLLLPVVSLHQRDDWITHGAATWWAAGWTLAGWLLATAVVAGVAGLFQKD